MGLIRTSISRISNFLDAPSAIDSSVTDGPLRKIGWSGPTWTSSGTKWSLLILPGLLADSTTGEPSASQINTAETATGTLPFATGFKQFCCQTQTAILHIAETKVSSLLILNLTWLVLKTVALIIITPLLVHRKPGQSTLMLAKTCSGMTSSSRLRTLANFVLM